MKNKLLIVALLLGTTACTPARIAGDVAVTSGQVILGAADLLL